MENDPLWIFLHPTKKKDKSYGVSIGTKLEFRSKKYVVEPSILNHINLTHKKLKDNGACINNALNEIKQYENITSSYNCEYFNNDETKSLLNDGATSQDILNIALKRDIDNIDKHLSKEWAIFKIWESQKFKKFFQNDSVILLKNILHAFIIMFQKKHKYYHLRRSGTNNICHAIYNKNDLNLLKMCLKSCILYYLDPEIGKNSIKKIKSILKSKLFRDKVFSLFYHIQVKHKHKFLIDGYLSSNVLKNRINAILFSYHKLYSKSIKTTDLYVKFISQNYTNLFPVSLNEMLRWKEKGGSTLHHIVKSDEYKIIKNAHKKDSELLFKISSKQASFDDKKRIEEDKGSNGLSFKENLATFMNNTNYRTSWGKITNILSVFFNTIVASVFKVFFDDDKKICHFDSFHRFIELYIRKGPTILFMVGAIIITEYIVKNEDSKLHNIISDEPDFDLLSVTGELNEEYKSKIKKDYQTFFEITKLKKKSSDDKNDLNFTVILEKLYTFIEYIETGWDNIDEIANIIMKDLKPFQNRGGKLIATQVGKLLTLGAKNIGLYFNQRHFGEIFYRKIIIEPNNMEMFGIDIDSAKPWYKEFKDKALTNLDNPGKKDNIKFICFDFYDLAKLTEKYHIKDKYEVKTEQKNDFCLNFVSGILPNNVGAASDLIHVESEDNNCFYSNVTSAQKKYIELMKHEKDQEEEETKKYSIQFDIEDEPSPAMKQEMEAIEKEMKESGDKPENILLERIEREKIEKEAIQKTNEDLLKSKDQRIQELENQDARSRNCFFTKTR